MLCGTYKVLMAGGRERLLCIYQPVISEVLCRSDLTHAHLDPEVATA